MPSKPFLRSLRSLSKKSMPWLLGLYTLYLIKTAMGINISDRYSAWEFVKAPVAPFLYK